MLTLALVAGGAGTAGAVMGATLAAVFCGAAGAGNLADQAARHREAESLRGEVQGVTVHESENARAAR